MNTLLKSRKFWIAIIDAAAGLLALYVTRFLQPEDAQMVIQTWALIQPVLLVWIGSIAVEDAAALKAGTHPSQQEN